MKKIILPIVSVVSVLFLANWGASDDTTVEGRKKPNVNFHGTLKTRQGKKRKVANITIGRMIRQIPVYEVPSSPDFVDKKTHTLKKRS